MFGPKTEEVMGGWSKNYNKELYDLFFSPDIIRMMKSRGL